MPFECFPFCLFPFFFCFLFPFSLVFFFVAVFFFYELCVLFFLSVSLFAFSLLLAVYACLLHLFSYSKLFLFWMNDVLNFYSACFSLKLDYSDSIFLGFYLFLGIFLQLFFFSSLVGFVLFLLCLFFSDALLL